MVETRRGALRNSLRGLESLLANFRLDGVVASIFILSRWQCVYVVHFLATEIAGNGLSSQRQRRQVLDVVEKMMGRAHPLPAKKGERFRLIHRN